MAPIKNFVHNSDTYDPIRSQSILFFRIRPIFLELFRQLTLCLNFTFDRSQMIKIENDTFDHHLYSNPANDDNRDVSCLADSLYEREIPFNRRSFARIVSCYAPILHNLVDGPLWPFSWQHRTLLSSHRNIPLSA